jgi:dihydroflavonol-4-reductase
LLGEKVVKCFVTGGTGFIGSHIVRLLTEAEHEVVVLVRGSSDLSLIEDLPMTAVRGDVTKPSTLRDAIPSDTELIFHNAAIMADWGGEDMYFPVNVQGTENMLEVCRIKGIPNFVHTSSTAVYGFPNEQVPIDEQAPWNPMNAYQKSKAESEKLLLERAEEFGFKATAVRAPVVFGHGDMFTGPQIIERMKDGNMVVFGGGDNVQTYVHAEDFARCLLLAGNQIEKSAGEAYNVGSFTCEFRELLEAFADELEVEPDFQNIPYSLGVGIGGLAARLYKAFNRENAPLITSFRVKMFGSEYEIDWSKAHEQLGYEPRWDLESTAKDVVDWGIHFKPR